MMRKDSHKKSFVLGNIVLFILVSVFPDLGIVNNDEVVIEH